MEHLVAKAAGVPRTCPFVQSISRTLLYYLDLRRPLFCLSLNTEALVLCTSGVCRSKNGGFNKSRPRF